MSSGDGAYDVIILDVDAKDGLETGMSFPPPAFLAEDFLGHLRRVLSDSGVLVVNISSRSDKIWRQSMQKLRSEFPLLRYVASDENVNRVVFASGERQPQAPAQLLRRLESIASRWDESQLEFVDTVAELRTFES